MRIRTALGTGLLVAALLTTLLPAVAHADDGRLVLDQSGGNGAVTGAVVDSKPGSARIVVTNDNEFWTTIDLSTLGVTLKPGPPLLGGPYAALGVIAPKSSATWNATWNARQAASVFVRTTPYIEQTPKGPLAAGLTVLSIVAKLCPGVSQAVATAESLQNAAAIVGTLLGDDLSELLTVDGLTSGRFGKALWGTLGKPAKVAVLREALALFGVSVTDEALTRLRDFIQVVQLGLITLDLASALLLGTSSGGVLFASEGTGASTLAPATTRPVPAPTAPAVPAPDRQALPAVPADPPSSGPGASAPNPSPSVPAPQADLRIIRVWTRDPGGGDRRSFTCGEQVRLSLELENPNAGPVPTDLSALVDGSRQLLYKEDRVTVSPGSARYNWSLDLPTDINGVFTFTADIFPEGGRGGSDASSDFTVGCAT